MHALSRVPSPPRGFTLLELVVVIAIIGLLSALAVPGIMRRLDNNKIGTTAEGVGQLFRKARMRAMGRGSAVLVRWQNGSFQMREGIWGDSSDWGDGCNNLPVSSCTADFGTRWVAGATTNHLLHTISFDGIDVSLTDTTDAVNASYDICFSPRGRAYWRDGALTGAFQALTDVPRVTVTRAAGGTLTRTVLIPPSGNARVTAR